jgi:hypothetical protein
VSVWVCVCVCVCVCSKTVHMLSTQLGIGCWWSISGDWMVVLVSSAMFVQLAALFAFNILLGAWHHASLELVRMFQCMFMRHAYTKAVHMLSTPLGNLRSVWLTAFCCFGCVTAVMAVLRLC